MGSSENGELYVVETSKHDMHAFHSIPVHGQAERGAQNIAMLSSEKEMDLRRLHLAAMTLLKIGAS